MPFIPHTADDIRAMLDAIGVDGVDALFDEIPPSLLRASLAGVPEALSEMDIMRLMSARADRDGHWVNFIGAGAYDHHVPAAIWQIVTRGEFYSAYTPYQAEASQGTLQLLYEYQSMMAVMTGLDVSNASLYDGASALAEAVLMAIRLHKGSHRILVPRTLNPAYRDVVASICGNQGVELAEIDYDSERGTVDLAALERAGAQAFAALIVPQPNYFGCLEPVHRLTDWAHDKGALVIGLVNPIALALLAPPGRWGRGGADVAVGEGQPLGLPLAGGGPYFGFMACKAAHVRQMPGRIAGRTTDLDGRPGYTLTLQAREQHIRRSKATSNICTNQGLAVAAATLYMALLGPRGMQAVAQSCHANLEGLLARLDAKGVKPRFGAARFHEAVLSVGAPVDQLLEAMREARILAGVALSDRYPDLGDSLLVCATETRCTADLDEYAAAMERAHGSRGKG